MNNPKKLVKLKRPMIRGDTPAFRFDLTLDGEPFDLTGWEAAFTCTPIKNPTDNTGAVVVLAAMSVDVEAGTATYQWTNTVTATLVPGTTYYFDVQVSKEPKDTNNFTVIRGQFEVEPDYGIGAS